MNKFIPLIIGLLMLSLGLGAQTLGEKYNLPEEPGELRPDGVYHLPVSLLSDKKNDVEAYFRFFPDGTFIVYHSRVSPKTKPEAFQTNCNYQYISSAPAPFNKDYTLKTSGNISRARIVYPDKAILLEFDVRKDVIAATVRTLDLDGKLIGQTTQYVMHFQPIAWPAGSGN
ncbi:MAG TPA: hypothetical protein PKE06_00250 [Flavilitoribacter sp.]|nr:hypothetical protein [Flavilitoribacter sp.]HMQ86554.1 hypothetical protein [Flavilitoribacter sp.]